MINVCVIGLGKWGKKVLNSIKKIKKIKSIQIVKNRRDKTKVNLNNLNWVFVTTPTNNHYSTVKKYLKKKVNVFCEKPLTNSIIKDNFTQLKKTIYFVQLGIFAKQSEVDKIRARMLLLGFDLNLKKIFFQGNIATKITLGPYDENILKDIEKILKKNNIKYLVINE